MKLVNGLETKLVLVVFVTAVVISGGRLRADFTFGEPTNLGPTVNSSAGDWDPDISADGLSLFFGSNRPGGEDIWVATRPTQNDPWDTPVNLGPTVNGSSDETDPSLSADGLSLFFRSNRPGGSGGLDLYVTTRATIDDPWREPVNLGPIVNSAGNDSDPSISHDGLSLYLSTFRGPRPGGLGGDDIWVTRRASTSHAWGEPVNLGPPINTAHNDFMPTISADGLSLFFSSDRPGGYGGYYGDIWVTTRATTDDLWGEPVNLGPTVSSLYNEADPSISADGSTLYFNSGWPPGDVDLWQLSIIPVVDLNGDGIVDAADMCIMVDHWGENYSLCDIGPTPLGDGIVDIQDLIVLAEHLFEELNDLTLVAYWAMDEIEGGIASDGANDNDGNVHGDPTWQPDGGMVDGALQLDGIDDYVSTPFVLNPADGKFSVFVWIKGGAPGQVVLSQMGGANWLYTDTLEGNLMTELKGPGRGAAILPSQTIIIDGDWHRIGLVWDGSHRTLYVDDIAVAEDTQDNLEGSENGLYIGTGKAMKSGTYWSGLIDDVRIYNRAVIP
ncbi:MAG: LamG-like jellyroll fold domain-containing protein [Phycisphaerae bacterium]